MTAPERKVQQIIVRIVFFMMSDLIGLIIILKLLFVMTEELLENCLQVK